MHKVNFVVWRQVVKSETSAALRESYMLVNNPNDWKMYFANSHIKLEKCLLPCPPPYANMLLGIGEHFGNNHLPL